MEDGHTLAYDNSGDGSVCRDCQSCVCLPCLWLGESLDYKQAADALAKATPDAERKLDGTGNPGPSRAAPVLGEFCSNDARTGIMDTAAQEGSAITQSLRRSDNQEHTCRPAPGHLVLRRTC
jgi:hypothetical protein